MSDSEDDAAYLRDMLGKQKMKEGAKVAAKTAKKQHAGQRTGGITGGGSFQSMGLPPTLLKALLQRGFTTPTPIQRLALPAALASPPRDIVGMARTGSGKTLAYMVPVISRLGGLHSPKYGARALVLVPTRELALQVLKVGKDLARAYKGKEGESGEVLRWGLVVGGDSLEEQYAMMASNPDVIIATPGRLLHLLVEMSTDLQSVQIAVFDEADRLFELGFDTALTEILSKMPPSRQTLLFSATLPKSLVEFAKAGLQNPKLVRLDAESKISSDLEMAFLSVKPKEKEAALLILLRDIIGVPLAREEDRGRSDWMDEDDDKPMKKRKRMDKTDKREKFEPNKELAPHQTIIFAATKHHVEYLSQLLVAAGYATSAIYGSLDQSARRNQLAAFRSGRTQLLVVTDLAARGIDIPILSNVVNYDFPPGSRTFVHRVGRTARAGRKGWAYSFVTNTELPYLFDLQLFLGRPLLVAPLPEAESEDAKPDYSNNIILGTLPRDRLDLESDHFRTALLEPSSTLVALLGVAEKGQGMYERSQTKASQESYRRAKELTSGGSKGLAESEREEDGVHPIFAALLPSNAIQASKSRADLLAQVNAFRPAETVFEIGSRGKTPASQIMQKRRVSLGKAKAKIAPADEAEDTTEADASTVYASKGEQVSEDALKAVFDMSKPKKQGKKDYRDSNIYMGYVQEGAEAEKGFSLNEGGTSFASQAASATYDLAATDEDGSRMQTQKASMLRWDRKHKKFVKGDGTGADNKKLIRTESGAKLPASFKSGSFDDWKKKQKVYLPKTGEAELKDRQTPSFGPGNKRFRHTGTAKTPSKPRRDGRGGVERETKPAAKKTKSTTTEKVRYGKGSGSQLKSIDQIRKERAAKAKRVKRSNQPGKRKK